MRVRGYWASESGAGAAEFALVVIPFLALIFGIINLSMMFYANHTLQYAAEAAARCYSISSLINSTACNSASAAGNYAVSRYSGPNIGATFNALPYPSGCGYTVTGAGTFPVKAVVVTINVPLATTACFP